MISISTRSKARSRKTKANGLLQIRSWAVKIICLFFSMSFIQPAEGGDYKLKSVPLKKVRICDGFWAPRIEINRTITIPLVLQKCSEKGFIDAFARAGGLTAAEHKGQIGAWSDTDVYKVMEGASYSLQSRPDRQLEDYLYGLVDAISAAQWPDGYIYTRYSLPSRQPEKRYDNVAFDHEIFCMGELIEMAVAYYEATGKRKILDAAIKAADHLDSVFGPEKRRDVPGHQVIALALVRLYKVTGSEKYLNLARFFLDERGHANGRQLYSNKGVVDYMQDHLPVVEQKSAVGHAVRAVYMYCGMTDVAAITGDKDYIKALDSIWENVVTRKIHINGAVGSRWQGEAFGDDYELPNKTTHSETCAAIANVFWNHRMNLLHGDAKYMDVLELSLYNRVLAGISLDGSSTFYKGPLASDGRWKRAPIKDLIHCCVTNLVRQIPQVGSYIYGTDDTGVYVNLYVAGSVETDVNETPVTIRQQTDYPWQGKVAISVEPDEPCVFDLNLRIPSWCVGTSPVEGDLYRYAEPSGGNVVIKINGQVQEGVSIEKGYARLGRKWKGGDVVDIELAMPIRRVYCNSKVTDNIGRVAVMRGPLVYCVEAAYNNGEALNIVLPDEASLRASYRKEMLNGITVIDGSGSVVSVGKDGKMAVKEDQAVRLIPYYAWANRRCGEMAVWLAREASVLKPALPSIASKSRVTTSTFWEMMQVHAHSLNDQLMPANSHDSSMPRFSWWPNVGTPQWAQYDFDKAYKVSAIEVYWVDERPMGPCRVPKTWRLLYKNQNGKFEPVAGASQYTRKVDAFNRVTFEPVETTALRIELEMEPGLSAGILEWRVE